MLSARSDSFNAIKCALQVFYEMAERDKEPPFPKLLVLVTNKVTFGLYFCIMQVLITHFFHLLQSFQI